MDVTKLFSCLIFFATSTTFALAQEANVTTLRFVHAIWRHGDRSQAVGLPSDKFNVESSWPQGYGELTKIGIQQHYELGKFLRARYNNFLSPSYNSSEIYIRSTDINRTIMSALANLAGMFPPSPMDQWNENITWQPIPVHSRPKNWDPMLYMTLSCPNYDKLLKNIILQNPAAQNITKEYKSFFKFMENKTAIPQVGLLNMYFVADPFVAQATHRDTNPWPSWFNESTYETLTKLLNIASTFWYSTFNLQRFRGGLLFYDIAARMKQKAIRNSTVFDQRLKYYVYSAHDMTQAALLCNIGIYNGYLSPYASVILLELHERQKEFHIEIFLRNGTTENDFHKLEIPGCNPCNVDEFLAMASIKRPSNWWHECGLPEGSDRITP